MNNLTKKTVKKQVKDTYPYDENINNSKLPFQKLDFKVIQNLSYYKNNQEILQKFYKNYDLKKLDRAENCAKFVTLSHLEHIETLDRKVVIDEIHTCDLRFCCLCSWRRQQKFSIITYNTIKELQETMKLRFLFLTLTVKNPLLSDLKENIKHMNKSFERMAKTKAWKNSILGYCRVFEITKPKCSNQKDNIHPHFHVLLAVKTTYFKSSSDLYLKKDDFAMMWQKALRVDYKPVCDVRIIKDRVRYGLIIEDNVAAIAELIKYPLKDSDLSKFTTNEFKILDKQMSGVRAINYGGILKEANKKLSEDIDIDESSLEMWREIEKLLMMYQKEHKKHIAMRSNVRGEFSKIYSQKSK